MRGSQLISQMKTMVTEQEMATPSCCHLLVQNALPLIYSSMLHDTKENCSVF